VDVPSESSGKRTVDPESVERDRRLVVEARKGSQDAYRQLVRRYERPIFSLVLRMVRSPDLAEDLTQEVFIKAFRALDSYDDRRKLSSWLFKIAHNATIDHLRRSSLRTVPLEEPESEGLDWGDRLEDPSVGSPDEIHEREELGRILEAAIQRLKPAFREVMLLRHREELAYGEIAEITGMSLGAVKTNLHRGRRALAELLETEDLDLGGRSDGTTE
jgi:RNA polymerase sigma-70 factor (ECF subfamily)